MKLKWDRSTMYWLMLLVGTVSILYGVVSEAVAGAVIANVGGWALVILGSINLRLDDIEASITKKRK